MLFQDKNNKRKHASDSKADNLQQLRTKLAKLSTTEETGPGGPGIPPKGSNTIIRIADTGRLQWESAATTPSESNDKPAGAPETQAVIQGPGGPAAFQESQGNQSQTEARPQTLMKGPGGPAMPPQPSTQGATATAATSHKNDKATSQDDGQKLWMKESWEYEEILQDAVQAKKDHTYWQGIQDDQAEAEEATDNLLQILGTQMENSQVQQVREASLRITSNHGMNISTSNNSNNYTNHNRPQCSISIHTFR